MRLWVGSIAPEDSVHRAGIYTVERDTTGNLRETRLAAGALRPAFLAVHPTLPVIYAVDDSGPGVLTTLGEGRDGTLETIGSEVTGGDGACHLDVHPSGRLLAVAHYWSGGVTFHPVGKSGAAGPPSCRVRYSGAGPDADRQSGSHPHCVRFTPNGALCVVADLGADTVSTHRVRLDDFGVEESFDAVADATPGSGPRHIAFTSPNLIHVSCELDATVTTFRLDESSGTLDRRSSVDATRAPAPERNYPSEIVNAPGTGFVYVANRGADLIAAFEVSGEGLIPLGEIAADGRWPRHLAARHSSLYVANQHSDEILEFHIDARTGCLSESGARAFVPSPACIAIETRAQTAAATPPSAR